MRLQVCSDLHLEFHRRDFPGERIVQPAPDADILVLVGDIAVGLEGVRLFANWPVPVLYVVGNHEGYGHELDTLRQELRRKAQGTSVVVLENETADLSVFAHWSSSRLEELAALRFLGCTLWTSYELPTVGLDRDVAMRNAAMRIADHQNIRLSSGGLFTPGDALREHRTSRKWLSEELSRPFQGKTVVITHHAPHESSVHPRYAGDSLNVAFASHLPELVEQADLWLHGHMHNSSDYKVGRCRVVCNPLGYPLNRGNAASVHDLVFENPEFSPSLVIEV